MLKAATNLKILSRLLIFKLPEEFKMNFESLFTNSDYRIMVSPGKMGKQAYEISKLCREIILHAENVQKRLENTSSYWESSGADAFRKINALNSEGIDELRIRLNNRMENLGLIIKKYSEAEEVSVEQSASLPDSVIS